MKLLILILNKVEKLEEVLEGFSHCRAYRFGTFPFSVFSLKLLDFPSFAHARNILVLDSDILFFARPLELLDKIHRGRPFYTRDVQEAYVMPREHMEELFDVELLRRVNAGFAYYPADLCDLEVAESFLAEAW